MNGGSRASSAAEAGADSARAGWRGACAAWSYPLWLPAAELLRYAAPPRGVWRWLLPPFFILSHAPLYELIEWAATLVFGSEFGTTYLGSQGDVWDSEKDVLLAVIGSLLALAVMTVAEFSAYRRQRASG